MQKILFLALCLFTFTTIWAQKNPVKWTFEAKKSGKNDYKVTLTATLDDKWAIYSQNLESDQGPVATAIKFELSEGQKEVSATKPVEVGTKIEGFDNTFEMNLVKYKKQVKFVQTIKAKKGQKIKGVVTYMTCDDNTCLPPRDVDFEILLK